MKRDSIVKVNDPIVMEISAYSNIAQKLNFLAQGIKNVKDAESAKLYIESYSDTSIINGKPVTVKVVRLSTDLYAWTHVHPYDKFNGDILDKNISVNLYDIYNVVDNCKDELISFWIDDENPESPELVINSFYQPQKDCDELEVRLKIHDIGYNTRDLSRPEKDPITSIALNNIALVTIIRQLNCENESDGLNLVVKNSKLRFESQYHGYDTIITINEYDNERFETDITTFIPFYVFNLMAATGQVTDVSFDIYSDRVYVSTEDYGFIYIIEEYRESFDIEHESAEDYFVIDSKLAEANISLINKLNKPAEISVLTFEKLNDGEAEITCDLEDRYTISVITDLAMLSDKVIQLDGDIFEEMFRVSDVDAIKTKTDNEYVYVNYRSGLIEKSVRYNHIEFNSYRKSRLEEWKKKRV